MNYHFIRLYTLVNFNYNVLGIELWVRGNWMRCQQNIIVFYRKNLNMIYDELDPTAKKTYVLATKKTTVEYYRKSDTNI